MSGRGRFHEYRTLLAVLVVMALLSPLGLYLPQVVKAGKAWGEWGVDEIRRAIGYAPAGMENAAGTFKAPLPDYAPPGQGRAPLHRRGIAYILSAFLGILACGGGAWLLGRWLAGRKGPPRP